MRLLGQQWALTEQKLEPDASAGHINDNTDDHDRRVDRQGDEREICSHALVEHLVAD